MQVDRAKLVVLKYFSSITNGVVMPSTEREEPKIVLSLGGKKEEKTIVVWK